MTSKAQEYLSVAVRFAYTRLTEGERSKNHDQILTIKQTFDVGDLGALIKRAKKPTLRAELHNQKHAQIK